MSNLTNSISNSNYGTLTITGDPSSVTIWSGTSSGTWYNPGYQYVPYSFSVDPISNLSNLSYNIYFSDDKDDLLKNNIVSIDGKLLTFNCDFVEKERIQPYELIMKMIYNKTKFTISIDVSDILTLKYTGVRFKSIENNFIFNNNCDFSTLKVRMKYKDVIYDNHKLHISEKRKEKLNKIMDL